jgi:ABC-type polysaccharide/polyol phosphate export permease
MGVLQGMKQITSNAILPKEILIIASVLANSVEYILSMLIAIPIAYFAGVPLKWTILMLPLVMVLQLLTVLWISLILSSLFVLIRDISHIYQVFLRLMFFTTPIFYNPDFLGDSIARYIVLLNPLSHLMNYSRYLLLDGQSLPALDFGLFLLLSSALVLFSFLFFKYHEPRYAELV